LSQPPAQDILGIAREYVILQYKAYKRSINIYEQILNNKRSIIAAGIYEKPIDLLNNAMSDYIAKFDYEVNPEEASIHKTSTNQELYEEWKALFDKMDE
jgi:hypothetical protein